MYHEWFCFRTL